MNFNASAISALHRKRFFLLKSCTASVAPAGSKPFAIIRTIRIHSKGEIHERRHCLVYAALVAIKCYFSGARVCPTTLTGTLQKIKDSGSITIGLSRNLDAIFIH